jgi:hypothetical protein
MGKTIKAFSIRLVRLTGVSYFVGVSCQHSDQDKQNHGEGIITPTQ